MHTPDGFLTSWICVVMLLLSLLPLTLALLNLKKNMTMSKVRTIAMVSAIIFLAQMLNFPIINGTSGHLLGAAFALFILGLDGAVVSMTMVLLVQAVVFGDGGILALGSNVFNMAIVGVYAASFVMNNLRTTELVKKFTASGVSVVAASLACAIQLSLSGIAPTLDIISAMTITHILIGIGEGAITLALLLVVANKLENLSWRIALGGLGISFVIAAMILPFASQDPDGLEKVAINLGFFEKATQIYSAPISDYNLVGFGSVIAGVLAALVGTMIVFATTYGIITATKDNL